MYLYLNIYLMYLSIYFVRKSAQVYIFGRGTCVKDLEAIYPFIIVHTRIYTYKLPFPLYIMHTGIVRIRFIMFIVPLVRITVLPIAPLHTNRVPKIIFGRTESRVILCET